MPDDRNFFDDSLPPDEEQNQARDADQRPPWEARSGEQPPEPQDDVPTPAPWELHPGEAEPAPEPPPQGAPWSSAPPAEPESLDALRQEASAGEDWSLADDEAPGAPPDDMGETSDDALDEPGADDFAWMRSFGDAAEPGEPVPTEEDDLAWLGSVEPGKEPPHEDAPSASRKVDAAELPWLDDETFRRVPTIEPEEELTLSPTDQRADEPPEAPEEPLPDWLSDEFGADTGVPDEPPAPTHEEPPPIPSVTSRLRPLGAEPPAEEEAPDWLSEADDALGAVEAEQPPEALTFDEWEQQQEEREREANKTPEERLLESVPDWLQQLRDQPETSASPAEPPAEKDAEPDFMPGWFLGLEDQPAEDAPGWLDKVDFTGDPLAAPPEPPSEPAPAPSGEEEMPDWFKGVGAPGEEDLPEPDLEMFGSDAAPAPERAAPAEDTPAFDQADEGEGDFVERFDPIAPDEFGASGDMPDWLLDLEREEPSEPAPAAEPPAAEPAPADDSLDWLNELSPDDVVADEVFEAVFGGALPPAEDPVATDEETAALAESELEQLLGSYEAPSPAAEAPAAETDEWADEAAFAAALDQALPAEEEADLESFFPEIEAGQPVPGLERLLDEEKPPADQPPSALEPATPEWVADLRPADLPVTVRAGGVELDLPQTPVIELPPRIHALRDKALRDIESTAPVPPAEAGALAGLAGAIGRYDTALPAAEPTGPLAGAVVTREQQARVQKLQALMATADEPEEAPEEEVDALESLAAPGLATRRVRRARRFKPDRVLIGLLMLAALVVPFVTDALHFAESPPPLSAAGEDTAAELDGLAPGAYVLVAFEYGPTAAGELDPLVEAVLRDTFAQGAIPLAISTNVAGALHAEAVLAKLAGDDALRAAIAPEDDAPASLRAGRDYTVLSYLSGDALGVRTLTETYGEAGTIHPAFATDLRGENTGLPIHTVAGDLALIVVAGEDTDDVRTWAEQLRGMDVPKVALVTAGLEPLITPYVQSEGYAGYLAGVRDAYSYNLARNANARSVYTLPENLDFDLPNPEDARWHSMALGAAAAAGLITLGMVLNLLRALVRRRS